MKNEEIVKALRRLKVETGSLVCMGCGAGLNTWNRRADNG